MILILCDSFLAACDAFDCFVDYMEHNEPWELRTVYPSCNMVITDDDLRYIFIHRKVCDVVDPGTADVLTDDEFFNDILDEYYYGGI